MGDVAAEAGVTRQTVYRYFASVDEILSAVAAAGAGEFLDAMAAALDHVRTVEEAVSETIIYCLHALPDEPGLGLMLRAGATESFSREVTTSGAVELGAQMLRRLPVDWAAEGYDDAAMEGLAELVMRMWLSFQQYPHHPPQTDDELRTFLRRWVCPRSPARG